MDHLVRPRPSTATHRVLVSDAGPCGAWRSRELTHPGQVGGGVAPARMPHKAGDRVHPDRREAVPWARLRRSGARTPVSVPPVADAARRDLTRARDDAMRDLPAAKCRLTAFLLRPDRRYPGRATWGPAPLRWLAAVGCAPPAQPIVFQADVRAVHEPTARLQRLEHDLAEPVTTWRLQPVVEALEGLRGVPGPVAVPLVAERGDLTRVAPPRPVRSALGLLPSASSRGERRRPGALPHAGPTHARRVLVEGAWASRAPATVRRPLPRRWAPRPTPSQDRRGQAHGRLRTRARRRLARGQPATPVVVAMARELAGCRGAMATPGPVTP